MPVDEPESSLDLVAYRSPGDVPVEIQPGARWRDWMNASTERFANRCLPLLVANQLGWTLINPIPFRAVWDGGADPSAVTIEPDDPGGPDPIVSSHFGLGIITWQVPYLFRTPPGFNLLARGPANWPKDGISPLEGAVEADWAVSTFTMNWKLTRPGHTVSFSADEPYCTVVPHRRGELEAFRPAIRLFDTDPELRRAFEQFSKGRGLVNIANRYAATQGKKVEAAGEWQGDYFRGQLPDGTPVPEHQTTLRLAQFEAPDERPHA